MVNKITVDWIELSGSIMPWSIVTMLSTWHWSSHVVIGLSNGNIIDASPGYGVSERKQKKLYLGWTKRYDLTKILGEDCRELMYRQAESMKGRPYDWRWIAGYAFGKRSWQDPEDWVCYEYAGWVLRGHINLPKKLYRVTGRHLEKALKSKVTPDTMHYHVAVNGTSKL